MTVPQPSFGPNGFVTPAEADILTAVKAEVNAAFGGDLNMADETPQGQIAVSQTAAIGNANDSFVFLSQQFDPAYASGRYQDAIARIYFLERNGALPTSVVCTCAGLAGVVIPAESLAIDAAGQIYASTGAATIGPGGTVSVTFANVVPGPTPCASGTLTTIYQAINGWDSITNPTDGVLGQNTESRVQFEARRFASVSNNAQGYLSAIRGAVLKLAGVIDCYVTENVNTTPLTVGGFTLGPKSLYVAVVGGDPNLIAQTIWTKKAPGCGYNGNTNVTIYDTNSGYQPPYPSYSVSFEIPTALTILFKVSVQTNASIPANAITLIQQAIVSAFAGGGGMPRVGIGAEIFASQFYSAVTSLGAWAQVRNIKVGSIQNPDAVVTGSIAATAMTVTAIASGTIVVGGAVSGTNVIDGTYISSQSSGTPGGIGVYVVNQSQTVLSTTLTMASATLDTLTPNINYEPTVSAADIVVSIS